MIIGTPPTYAPVVQDEDRLASKGWMSWFSAMARAFNGNWYKGSPTIKFSGPTPISSKLTMTPYHAMTQIIWDKPLTTGGIIVIDSVKFDYGIITLMDGTTQYTATINSDGNIVLPVILLVTDKIILTAVCAVIGKEI